PRYAPGWAVGSWFVPIMNLFRPVQMMGDVFRISASIRADSSPRGMPGLVQAWWAAWLLSAVLSMFASGFDDLALLIASHALDILSFVLTFAVVAKAADLQRAKHTTVAG
ncbi:MAG: DUF4328 domain-containing protein, partial [Deltaproteobacteria bacterium]|nr:DUF4328 domain-containing protein [Deltaproteobacteria bacterium]